MCEDFLGCQKDEAELLALGTLEVENAKYSVIEGIVLHKGLHHPTFQ
jgi:hypothetical protein